MSAKYLGNPTFRKRLLDVVNLAVGGGIAFVGINIYMKNEKFYDSYIMPLFHKLDPETAHQVAIAAAKYNLVPTTSIKQSNILVSVIKGQECPRLC
ncbi:hypothetical protein SK128_016645 [Halocaridina rubra]|uniref:Uncharacterized protein n=1 Tax=Halocaridina rubra TaxID=373956 RepID=A0AAN8WLP6_HALRR